MSKTKKRSATEAFGVYNTIRVNGHVFNPQATPDVKLEASNNANPVPVSTNLAEKSSSYGIQRSEKVTSKLKRRAIELQLTRKKLPIYDHADEIKSKLRQNDVLLLVGETGSGKSTQVPRFLLNERWCREKKVKDGVRVGGTIAITEPRRVAAISLARRVAEEMGTPLGNSSPASQVGYSVRFDNSTSPSTRIKFLTEGMLLQEMLRDPWLKEYSAVVVDEVHERGVNVDLALGFLRRLQTQRNKDDGRGGIGIKVVVMSATADMDLIHNFFTSHTPTDGVDSSLKQNGHKQAEEEWNGFSDAIPDNLDASTRQSEDPASAEKHSTSQVSTLHILGRQHKVEIHYSPTPVADILDAAFRRITHIHAHSPLPGDILVFLTGQETVESLLGLVEDYSISIQKNPDLLPRLLILPLYAALPTTLQQKVFEPTPPSTRKIILATNIAETSITVPGIRHVIDTGKHKRRLFRPSLNLDSLLTVPISRSSAKQRSGRAGRDAPGHAYRLYTEQDHLKLQADTDPEILRCDLSQLVLTLKAHGVDDITAFPLLTTPPRRAMHRAMVHLLQLSALDPSTGSITSIGKTMSRFPLSVSLSRILLASTSPELACRDETIDIVAALSVENVFLNIHCDPQSDRDDEYSAAPDPRLQARRLLHRREGDHLTLLATVQAYVAENTDRKRWCEEYAVSHRAMSAVMDVRKQLRTLSQTSTMNEEVSMQIQSIPLQERILRTLLTGLHPNVARLCPDGTYKTLLTNQVVNVHPSSVLFGQHSSSSSEGGGRQQKFEAIMYSEFVYTNKTYARGVSAVRMVWVEDVIAKVSGGGNIG